MRKGYKLLSADHTTAVMVSDAIIKLRKIRVFSKRPNTELFKAFTPGIGTQAEANRIVDFLIADRVIVKDGTRFKWNGDINLWDDSDRRRSYVLAMLLHSDDTKKPVLCEKKSGKVSKQLFNQSKPVADTKPITKSSKDYAEDLSDNALKNEIARLTEILESRRRHQEQVQSILNATGLTKEEILEILK
jgi:hypothetical protein